LHRHDIAPLFDRAGASSIWHIGDAAVPQWSSGVRPSSTTDGGTWRPRI